VRLASSSPARSWAIATPGRHPYRAQWAPAPTLEEGPISRTDWGCTAVAIRPANGPLSQRSARGRARVGSCQRHARTTPYIVGGAVGSWRDAPSSPSLGTGWSVAMSALGEEGEGGDWRRPPLRGHGRPPPLWGRSRSRARGGAVQPSPSVPPTVPSPSAAPGGGLGWGSCGQTDVYGKAVAGSDMHDSVKNRCAGGCAV